MKLNTQPYKGTRDFYPEDMRLRKWMFSKLREVCESYGYEEYDGPVLEPLDIYTAKTSEEIVNEQSFSFTDRGDRNVIMRPEMTPTVSRMVAAKRQELGYPLRLYSIPNFFRYEKPQKGRLREFWQLNADIFGIEGIEADVEIIQLADSIMKSFGAKEGSYEIRVNSKKLLNKATDSMGFDGVDKKLYIKIRDKWGKFESENDRLKYIDKCLEESGYGESKKKEFLSKLDNREYIEDVYVKSDESKSLRDLVSNLTEAGVNIKFNAFLMRGFDYYTDIVFEVFDTTEGNSRSLFGGGRYDGLVGQFGVEPVPTVGFGMGDVTLQNFLESNNLIPNEVSEPSTELILIGDGVESSNLNLIGDALRKQGKNIAVDYTERKLDKKIKSAQKLGNNKIIIVRPENITSKSFTIIDLKADTKQNIQIDF